jgi:nucleoside-diphosphate-sugar epimerase
VVFPLVAIATPVTYVTDPLAVFELDFEANLKVVRWCVAHKKRIVFPSTSEVYGMALDDAFDEHETSFVQGPIHKQRWIYSCSKQLLDRIIYAYGVQKGLKYTLFRPFNFIGAKLDDIHRPSGSRVVTQFLHSILYESPIILVDGGRARRCFTFIDDGVDCLMKILENSGNVADGRIFNVGNPKEEYSIAELADEMVKVYAEFDPHKAKEVKIESVDAAVYYGESYQDVERRTVSIREAKEYLGWEPKTSLREALRIIFSYHLEGKEGLHGNPRV